MSSTTTRTLATFAEGAIVQLTDHADLIDHHAAHSQPSPSSSASPNDLAWHSPAPAHGVPGGGSSRDWIAPESWPQQRGTPVYRPIDYRQDTSRRQWANSIPEQIFVRTMIGAGVQTIGLTNTFWRNTFGRFEALRGFFRYQAPHEL
ncbi:uncharacterized protein PFL1_00328 [Pseudozyma flocculosa PF-1]|uniref:Uncharacterized protein n=1 Tax=Pseudozyma flocculosa TaxID=84751 RepID=A0A5C3ES78_9BASI|nr:uncharacterized protein PFL1_00328 [Pseudozyma flocculosa PF-1]EPQ32131.1 hypothetical protein PFL1_00328 [Pseudozyma flocculosa PF-1]SPO34932.1 uncharacterized protein PSFLO_00403 [Pseudozyma flocculosa]